MQTELYPEHMNVIITGGGGFLGSQLAKELLRRGTIQEPGGTAVPIGELTLFDQHISPLVRGAVEEVRGGTAVRYLEGDIGDATTVAGAVRGPRVTVFHLASMVSGECEVRFDDAMGTNLDGFRHLLEAARALGTRPRIVFSSSIAVFGGAVMGPMVSDATKATPQTTYGMTKYIGELMINDYSRKGFIDGRTARLPTIIIRPGKPNTAASSFASGVFREPLAGQPCDLPVDRSQRMPVLGYRDVVQCFLALQEVPEERLGDDRAYCLPNHNPTVAEMIVALEAVAAGQGRALGPIRDTPDAVIRRIVDSWPVAVDAGRALELGLPAGAPLETLVRQYIEDFAPAVG